jgi:hypothetical protein
MRADKTGLNNFLKKITTVKLITNKNGFIIEVPAEINLYRKRIGMREL